MRSISLMGRQIRKLVYKVSLLVFLEGFLLLMVLLLENVLLICYGLRPERLSLGKLGGFRQMLIYKFHVLHDIPRLEGKYFLL